MEVSLPVLYKSQEVAGMAYTAITNIGTLVSGNIDEPMLMADTIIIHDGKIEAVGDKNLLNALRVHSDAYKLIDAGGMTVIPGLIDSHVHPVIGDYTPRQKMADFIDSSLHGGVTTMISAGECHTPGRPTDPAGVKAHAVLAQRSFQKQRPSGVKVHGGGDFGERVD